MIYKIWSLLKPASCVAKYLTIEIINVYQYKNDSQNESSDLLKNRFTGLSTCSRVVGGLAMGSLTSLRAGKYPASLSVSVAAASNPSSKLRRVSAQALFGPYTNVPSIHGEISFSFINIIQSYQ